LTAFPHGDSLAFEILSGFIKISMQIKKVLMADDDRSIRSIAEIIFSNATDWQVEIVSSGQEVLECIALDQPDVVLLDVNMPGMDGLSTLAAIRRQLQIELPVIFLTARDKRDARQYSELGLAGIITKPFDPIQFTNKIEELVAAWLAKNAQK